MLSIFHEVQFQTFKNSYITAENRHFTLYFGRLSLMLAVSSQFHIELYVLCIISTAIQSYSLFFLWVSLIYKQTKKLFRNY